jgi:hypothetical protein
VPDVAHRLIQFRKEGLAPCVMVIRRERADFERARREGNDTEKMNEQVGVVVRLTRHTPSGQSFTVYEVWEFERWNYWRCREQLKLLFAFCDHMRIYIVGHELPNEKLESLSSGRHLPIHLLNRLGAVTWFPYNFASVFSEVLQEVDEWPGILSSYTNSILPKLAGDAGATAMPCTIK